MPRQISKQKIVDSIINGFIEAQQTYEKMSGGLWLWQAPEYFITSNVAKNIYSLEGSKYVTLEHGSSNAIENAGAKGRGKLPTDIREKGRVDILLWWANDTPRAIIEIKNQIYTKAQYEKDIQRIKSFLKLNSSKSSLQFGVFAFYESAFSDARKNAKEKINDRIEKIHNNSKSILGSEYDAILHRSDMFEDIPENMWQVACILVQMRNT